MSCFRVSRTHDQKSDNGKSDPKTDDQYDKPAAGEWEEEKEEMKPRVGRHAGIRVALLRACCMKGRCTVSRGITMIKSLGRESKIKRPPSGKDMPGPPQPRPRETRY